MNYLALEQRYEFGVYPKRELVLVRGENARVWDVEGKAYIDCVAGHGVANIGHCNPAVLSALEEQAKKLITCSAAFYNDVRALLLQKLVEITPRSLTRAFLCNSGTEAIEAAIKFARFTTGKTDFICATRSFHGRTLGALSATHKPAYREPFEPLVPGFSFVPFNNFEKLEAAVTEKTTGIILEVVQGEGGVHIGDAAYFKQVQELCKQKGILLIIDEVQTGFGRTGKLFACEHFAIEPDVLCLAKSIAGGIPMGAVLCSDRMKIPHGKHGTTFGGNPLACAAALATIDYLISHNLAAAAAEKGAYVAEKLQEQKLTKVREIRQLGLMVGIELKQKVKSCLLKLIEEGVLAMPAGATVLRLLPPLTISYEELDVVVEKLVKVLRD